jgi:hypothetical protein
VHKYLLLYLPLAFTMLLGYSVSREKSMNLSEPNQAIRRSVGVSTALISKLGLIIIGVGVTGPA